MSQAVKGSTCHAIWFNTLMYWVMELHKVHLFHCIPSYFLNISISISRYTYKYTKGITKCRTAFIVTKIVLVFPVINYLFAREGKKNPYLWSPAKDFTANKLQNIWVPENSGKVSSLICVDSWKRLGFSYQVRDKRIPSAFI